MTRCLILIFLSFTLLGQVVPGRYIVEFTAEPAAGASPIRTSRFRAQDSGVQSRMTTIRVQQAAAERRIGAMNGTIRHRLTSVANALVVDIADSRAIALASLPGVKSVQQD